MRPILAAAMMLAPPDPTSYISDTWSHLERWCGAKRGLLDPKMQPDQKPVVYISQKEDLEKIRHILSAVSVRVLPDDPLSVDHHGLLYLPKPYITPGGRFNEMYGWDSFFIFLGLIEEGKTEMADHLIDNQLYQIEHYGHVLNSNRTYHLSRSHPPFISQMVLRRSEHDPQKLERAYPLIEKYYRFWTTGKRCVPEHHLCRYYDDAKGPAIEVISSEIDHTGMNHFDRIERLILSGTLIVPIEIYRSGLTEAYYLDDRAMRESGFDVSCCFGPYGIETTKQLPVCLNTLLYLMEVNLEEMARKLGKKEEEKKWRECALRRKNQVNALLWNEKKGLYVSYNFDRGEHHCFPFLTAYYPMWAGIATKEQAATLVNLLSLFERKWGLVTSTEQTGCQWDSPFGWAPLHYIVVMGLLRYGYEAEAKRIAEKFCALVEKEYRRTGHIFEKYDVIKGTADVHLDFGYESNEPGFGWTNAVYLLFRHRLNKMAADESRNR